MDNSKNILLTTAISYTNGDPHIGHLYESVLADFLNRVYKLAGYNSKLLTGTDEHGKKIQDTATALEITPQQLCDNKAALFKQMNQRIGTEYDYFIRTTEKSHKDVVRYALEQSKIAGDIYKDVYSGWYNTREECYVAEAQARETEFCDPVSGKAYEKVEEETYNFRLSKYEPDLNVIYPEEYRDSQQQRLADLKDISISRTTFDWGIPIPWENGHITYVWFDALLNYVSGGSLLYSGKNYKPVHLIGKDILWFHSVIYPAILKSCGWFDKCGPHKILVHGFILDAEGRKMSKSLRNVVSIEELLEKYHKDAVRYYLIVNTLFGQDLSFNYDILKANYNNELIKGYGNLYQRFFNMVRPILADFNTDLEEITLHEPYFDDFLETFDFQGYRRKIGEYMDIANKKITDEKPWTMATPDKVKCLTEVYYYWVKASILLWAIIPTKIEELFGYLGIGFSKDRLQKINITTAEKIRAFEMI